MGITIRLVRLKGTDVARLSAETLFNKFFVESGGIERDILDLDKSAEGISFLLSGKPVDAGTDNPLRSLFSG